MEIIRFALGIRLAPAEMAEGEQIKEALSLLFAEVPKKRFAGMRIYAGKCRIDENDDPNIITLVTMGQGIKKTKALYNAIVGSHRIADRLAAYRPIILTNTIARLEGLDLIGEFNKKGELISIAVSGMEFADE